MAHSFRPCCMNPVEEGKPCAACGLTQGADLPFQRYSAAIAGDISLELSRAAIRLN